MFHHYKEKGEITVFLSLIIATVFALVCVVIKSAKVISMNIQAEAYTEAALKSALYEYNVALSDKYGLYFVDTRYHGGLTRDAAFAVHIENYIAESLYYTNSSDMYCLKVESVDVVESVYVNDNSYQPLVQQINDYENSKGVYGSDAYLLDDYLYTVVLPGEIYDEDLIFAMTYDEKLNYICQSIESDITSITGRRFSFSDCLYKAKIRAKYSGVNGYSIEIEI